MINVLERFLSNDQNLKNILSQDAKNLQIAMQSIILVIEIGTELLHLNRKTNRRNYAQQFRKRLSD